MESREGDYLVRLLYTGTPLFSWNVVREHYMDDYKEWQEELDTLDNKRKRTEEESARRAELKQMTNDEKTRVKRAQVQAMINAIHEGMEVNCSFQLLANLVRTGLLDSILCMGASPTIFCWRSLAHSVLKSVNLNVGSYQY
jgi:hypothetical protein